MTRNRASSTPAARSTPMISAPKQGAKGQISKRWAMPTVTAMSPPTVAFTGARSAGFAHRGAISIAKAQPGFPNALSGELLSSLHGNTVTNFDDHPRFLKSCKPVRSSLTLLFACIFAGTIMFHDEAVVRYRWLYVG